SLELSASRGTNILNSLEKKGLVQRRSDSRDKRKVYIFLTQEGRSFIEEKHQEAIRHFERIFRKLGQEDSENYIRIMKRFYRIMEEEIREFEE
ncbi:MAG TPA: MarR family transcriptional regulator, partial [Candidatus Blautia ornithocaccae]|nr:MarR family transcriptional regulator [Candidatus Blautia ornithocaccae]